MLFRKCLIICFLHQTAPSQIQRELNVPFLSFQFHFGTGKTAGQTVILKVKPSSSFYHRYYFYLKCLNYAISLYKNKIDFNNSCPFRSPFIKWIFLLQAIADANSYTKKQTETSLKSFNFISVLIVFAKYKF